MAPTILIVDDAGAFRNVLRRVLETAGFQVTEAQDVDAALQCLERVPVDMVLTDIQMPGRSGVELAGILIRNFPHIKVIAMSAFEDVTRLPRELGIHAGIRKPMKPEALVDTLREAFAV